MTPERPNIIYILTDDQARGPRAATAIAKSAPNIDRLADTGVRFQLCGLPGLLTEPRHLPDRAHQPPARIMTDPRGNSGEGAVEFADEVAYTDVFAAADTIAASQASGTWATASAARLDFGMHERGGGDYNAAPMIRDGKLVIEDGYITDIITDEALGYLHKHAGDSSPFFLSVHYTAPHSPWTGHPQEIVDSYDDCPFETCPQEPRHPWAISLTDNCLNNREMLKGYFAAVTAMDANVGRIIDRVEELGLRENTLIVFCSDNGFSCGYHGFGGGQRHVPANMHENSITVPFAVSHPAPAGHASV